MSNHTNRARQDANRGYAQPNTDGMSRTQADQAQKAFKDQQAKNNSKKG